jgi:hypothetical protein
MIFSEYPIWEHGKSGADLTEEANPTRNAV